MTSVHDVTYDLLRRDGITTVLGNPEPKFFRRWPLSKPGRPERKWRKDVAVKS